MAADGARCTGLMLADTRAWITGLGCARDLGRGRGRVDVRDFASDVSGAWAARASSAGGADGWMCGISQAMFPGPGLHAEPVQEVCGRFLCKMPQKQAVNFVSVPCGGHAVRKARTEW